MYGSTIEIRNIQSERETYCCLFLSPNPVNICRRQFRSQKRESLPDVVVGSLVPIFPFVFFSSGYISLESYFILFDKNSKFCQVYQIFLSSFFPSILYV